MLTKLPATTYSAPSALAAITHLLATYPYLAANQGKGDDVILSSEKDDMKSYIVVRGCLVTAYGDYAYTNLDGG